jgi:hypothetical protein
VGHPECMVGAIARWGWGTGRQEIGGAHGLGIGKQRAAIPAHDTRVR